MPAASTDFVAVEQMRQAGVTLLEELSEELRSGREIMVELRMGGAPDAIADIAENIKAEFVVVGSRGLGSVGALILGSVSLRLAVHGPCPTVIVPSLTQALGAGPIMCAVDDSDHSREAVATAASLAERLGVRLLLAHAEPEQATSLLGRELLTRLASETGLGKAAEGILVHGEPAKAILEEAEAHGVAMIVIGSRGRGALASSVLGSVSSAVASRSRGPVTIVRARAESALTHRPTETT